MVNVRSAGFIFLKHKSEAKQNKKSCGYSSSPIKWVRSGADRKKRTTGMEVITRSYELGGEENAVMCCCDGVANESCSSAILYLSNHLAYD